MDYIGEADAQVAFSELFSVSRALEALGPVLRWKMLEFLSCWQAVGGTTLGPFS